jgi:hypothetical protein
MAMNTVVTPHQPICLYSAAGEQGEPPERPHWLSSGPQWIARRSEYFNRFSITSSEKVFFGPSVFRSLCVFHGSSSLRKERSSTAKGLLLGVFYSIEGPQDEDPAKKQHCGMPKLGNFGSAQAKNEKGLVRPSYFKLLVN